MLLNPDNNSIRQLTTISVLKSTFGVNSKDYCTLTNLQVHRHQGADFSFHSTFLSVFTEAMLVMAQDCPANNDTTGIQIQLLLLLLRSRFSRLPLRATPQTAAHQAPPALGFSRHEHWSGLPFPSPQIQRVCFSSTILEQSLSRTSQTH